MKSYNRFYLILPLFLNMACKQRHSDHVSLSVLGKGQMPNLIIDKTEKLHLVYGSGDSIMYVQFADRGESFSLPSLVAILPGLTANAMRGPQIASTDQGVTILASNASGDIYCYLKDESGGWTKTMRVNDADTVAKEGFMALSGDGKNLFAVWLDLRRNKRNKIVGANSNDAGRTWSKNALIYASPDSTVCECCKPSVAVKGNNVYVMFRNSLNGSRDLYLIQSHDGGNNFGTAEKLGNGTWPLNGCPMDGGGLVVNTQNQPQTVWRRKNKIFSCAPGESEIEIGEGRSCTIESFNDKNVYAWTENGEVLCLLPDRKKEYLGRGMLPVIKAINSNDIICVWENDSEIHAAILEL